MLRPGAERVQRLGGLHRFMRWDKPDPDRLRRLPGHVACRRSPRSPRRPSPSPATSTARKHVLSPERSIEIQADLLGSDIVMQLDECVAWPAEEDRAREAMELSARWGARSKAAFGDARRPRPCSASSRARPSSTCAANPSERLIETGFDGYAIGGLAVGEGHQAMCEVLDYAPAMLPADRPRYLMGVGKPIDLVEAVARGVDMFDCVLPTRSGRHGQAWTWDGPINLKNARFAEDQDPLDPDVRLPRQPRLFKGLPAPPGQVGGDPGPGAAQLAQHRLLPGPDGRHARRHRRRPLRRLPPRFPRPAGPLTPLLPTSWGGGPRPQGVVEGAARCQPIKPPIACRPRRALRHGR